MGAWWLQAGIEEAMRLQDGREGVRWLQTRTGEHSRAALGWDGKISGAASWNELRNSRLRRWELGGSRLGGRNLSTSSWDRGSWAALGCGAWCSPRWSKEVPESGGRRELGNSGLRQKELDDSRLKIELGGSMLRGKEHHLSRPGMRKLGCSRL